jgi:hypothetical protein
LKGFGPSQIGRRRSHLLTALIGGGCHSNIRYIARLLIVWHLDQIITQP